VVIDKLLPISFVVTREQFISMLAAWQDEVNHLEKQS